MKQTWANPNPANGAYGRKGNFYTDKLLRYSNKVRRIPLGRTNTV
jgi:hypothetical protein